MVVAYHTRGLCNRLKCLLSAMRMDDDYRIIWPISDYMPCSFNCLFVNDIEIVGKFQNTKSVREKFGNNWYGTWRFLVLPEDNVNHEVDFMYNDTPDIIKKVYLEKIKLLKPIEYVANNIESFSKNFDDRTVSVSIRSWADIQHGSSKKRSKTFDINKFIRAMDRMENVSSFFITCDSSQIIKRLKYIFRNKVITYPHRTSKEDTKTVKGMQDIVVDLFLGGKNKRLIASGGSTFTELQWWFGGCKADVVVVPSY